MLKPEPRFEATTRPRLHLAADAARQIDGHYRLAGYSDATRSGTADPRGPAAIAPANDDPYGDPWWGPKPTVCSSFVRQALVDAGIEVDRDTTSPFPSPLPSELLTFVNQPSATAELPPGLFLYDANERRAGADALFAHLVNTAQVALWELEGTTDDYWWAGGLAGGALGFLVGGPSGLVVGAGTGIALTDNAGAVLKWVTDAPRDVANQVTNCFASDACAHEDRNHQRWKHPRAGVAVSPDDLMNYYDSPATGGVYGYHERLVYRGLRYRPVFTWQKAEGAYDLEGSVTQGGQPASGAMVEVPGIPGSAVATPADGLFTLRAVPGPNVMVHASRWVGEEATGYLAEAYACLVAELDAESDAAESVVYFRQASCDDLAATLDSVRLLPAATDRRGCYAQDPSDPTLLVRVACDGTGARIGQRQYRERLPLELGGPDPAFRHVVISGPVHLTDCDCSNRDERGKREVFAVCDVSEHCCGSRPPAHFPTQLHPARFTLHRVIRARLVASATRIRLRNSATARRAAPPLLAAPGVRRGLDATVTRSALKRRRLDSDEARPWLLSVATGGASATGGQTQTGGVPATGSAAEIGGALPATGGSTETGGAAPATKNGERRLRGQCGGKLSESGGTSARVP